MSSSFAAQFQVRFDECAADGSVRASALLRYVVETAFAHSADKGFPLSWYDSHRVYWLVRRGRLELTRPAAYGALLTVTTDVVGFRRIWARRRNTIEHSDGSAVGLVTMDWIFTDSEGNPTRILPEMAAAFPGVPARLQPEHLVLASPPHGVAGDEYAVPAHQVDPRGHLNNAAYIDLFEDALAAQGVEAQVRPVTYELEVFRAPRQGESLRRFVWEAAGGWSLLVLNPPGDSVAKGRRSPAPARSEDRGRARDR